MNSFYGMSQNQKPFVFDKIYGSYTAAESAIRTIIEINSENVWVGDGVYPGRYILIEYEHKDSDYDYTKKPESIYEQNKARDSKVSTIRKNYDSTVWMKKTDNISININNVTNLKLTDFYVNVADLNSPFISLNEVNPTINFAIPADPIGTRITDIPENTITLSAPNSTSGQLTQVLDIKIQSVGKAISDVYDKLYGESRDSENTATDNVAGAINRINELIKAATTNNYLGVNEDDKWLADDGAGLKHINKVKNNTNPLALSSFSSISITLTSPTLTTMEKLETKIKNLFNTDSVSLFTPNNTKLEYKLKTLNTDKLGHVITVEDSSENKSIELPIGFTPSGLKNTTFYFYKNYPIYQNIGSIVSGDSFSDNLWSQIRGINKILGVTTNTPDYTDSAKLRYSWNSSTNIIGSSATTNTNTANLWGNIHNINNIIGLTDTNNTATTNLWGNIHRIDNIIGSIDKKNTLWGDIGSTNTKDTLWWNIQGIWTGIGSVPSPTSITTIWGNIGSTNSKTNTLWGKISSIETNVASISNNIGSSSDPTNTTTVWSNINRIDSIVGTPTSGDTVTLCSKINNLEYTIIPDNFTEPQYVPRYAVTTETDSYPDITGFTKVNFPVTLPTTSTEWNNTYGCSPSVTDKALGNDKWSDWMSSEPTVYEKDRDYEIIYKKYNNGILECDGKISNIMVFYGDFWTQTGQFFSSFDGEGISMEDSKAVIWHNTGSTTYLYAPIFNRYKFFNDTTFSFSTTPTLTITVEGGGKQGDIFLPTTITKDYFSGYWYSVMKKDDYDNTPAVNTGSTAPYKLTNYPKTKINSLNLRGENCFPHWTVGGARDATEKSQNTDIALHFHAIGRWEEKETS